MADKDIKINIPDDDFANDKDVQDNRAAIEAYKKMIADCQEILRLKLNARETIHKTFEHFITYRNLDATPIYSLQALFQGRDLHISIVEYFVSFPFGKHPNSGTDRYLIGYFSTKKKFPSTYIHKETIGLKITDLFLNRDVDFDNSRKFSRQFQVLTNDQKRLQDLLQFEPLDNLTLFPEMEVELQENGCLFRISRNAISVEETTTFCELATSLMKLLR